MQRNFYAVEHSPYGRAIDMGTGERIANFYRFSSRAARDRFVADSLTDYVTEPGYREVILRNDPHLARALRRDALEARWPSGADPEVRDGAAWTADRKPPLTQEDWDDLASWDNPDDPIVYA